MNCLRHDQAGRAGRNQVPAQMQAQRGALHTSQRRGEAAPVRSISHQRYSTANVISALLIIIYRYSLNGIAKLYSVKFYVTHMFKWADTR
jgi:hypothetical protein